MVLRAINSLITLFYQRPSQVLYSALSSPALSGPDSAASRRAGHHFELDSNLYEHHVALANTCVRIHICF